MSNTTWPWSQSNGAPASLFGALPAQFQLGAPPLGVADLISFHFTSFAPSILNCTVMGPRSIVYYKVVTAPGSSTTTLRDNQGSEAALLGWSRQPYVQMGTSVPKQKVLEWLPLSSNKASRKMFVQNVQYRWVPIGNDIYLTNNDGSRGLGRIVKSTGLVTLELTHDAMYAGLLEPCIVATIALQSGCNLD